jgi:hypothetical protein
MEDIIETDPDVAWIQLVMDRDKGLTPFKK